MTLYVVSKARFDDQGEVTMVEWGQVTEPGTRFVGEQQVVPVDRVVEALDRGDNVEIRFHSASGWLSGGPLVKKVLASGAENIKTERQDEGQQVTDLPTF